MDISGLWRCGKIEWIGGQKKGSSVWFSTAHENDFKSPYEHCIDLNDQQMIASNWWCSFQCWCVIWQKRILNPITWTEPLFCLLFSLESLCTIYKKILANTVPIKSIPLHFFSILLRCCLMWNYFKLFLLESLVSLYLKHVC